MVDDMSLSGLRQKYAVSRIDGRDRPGGDKENARYFVLDFVNDPYAREALSRYAAVCTWEYPDLAEDLWAILDELESDGYAPTRAEESGA